MIVIRPFKPAYLEQVKDINRRCNLIHYTPDFFMDAHARFQETFLVAEEDGRLDDILWPESRGDYPSLEIQRL